MARNRYTTGSGTIGVSSPTTEGVIPSVGVENADYGITQSQIIERVRQSSIYQSVFAVFSQESDKYWLTELQGIIDSIIGANKTFWDEIGASSASGDRVEQIYQDAINNIRTLYNQYRTYKNSLPVTQVQQLSDAGINSAITGNGVTGSSLPQSDIASGASSMPSTNAVDHFSQIASFALDTVSGLTNVMSSIGDVIYKFRDLDLRSQIAHDSRTQSFSLFKESLAKDGVILQSNSWEELPEKDPNWNNSASTRSKALHNAYEEIVSSYQRGPLVSHSVSHEGYSDPSIFGGYANGSHYLYPFGVALSKDLQDVGQLEFELAVAKARHSVKVRQSQVDNNLTPEDLVNAENSRRIADSEYEEAKAKAFLKRFNSLVDDSNKNSLVAKVELINMMQNADWQESLMYLLGEKGEKLLDKVGGKQFKQYINEISK